MYAIEYKQHLNEVSRVSTYRTRTFAPSLSIDVSEVCAIGSMNRPGQPELEPVKATDSAQRGLLFCISEVIMHEVSLLTSVDS